MRNLFQKLLSFLLRLRRAREHIVSTERGRDLSTFLLLGDTADLLRTIQKSILHLRSCIGRTFDRIEDTQQTIRGDDTKLLRLDKLMDDFDIVDGHRTEDDTMFILPPIGIQTNVILDLSQGISTIDDKIDALEGNLLIEHLTEGESLHLILIQIDTTDGILGHHPTIESEPHGIIGQKIGKEFRTHILESGTHLIEKTIGLGNTDHLLLGNIDDALFQGIHRLIRMVRIEDILHIEIGRDILGFMIGIHDLGDLINAIVVFCLGFGMHRRGGGHLLIHLRVIVVRICCFLLLIDGHDNHHDRKHTKTYQDTNHNRIHNTLISFLFKERI